MPTRTTIGISLDSSNNNTLSGNNANSNKRFGISLLNSSNNNIYNNYFNNTINFRFINTGINTWNTTRISATNIIAGPYIGGNFWANPSGTGFSQTCTDTDRDGICDSPYVLDASNIDYLPLASPDTIVLPTEKVSVSSATVAQGGKITVPIQVTNITSDIAVATVILSFNPAIINVESVNAGDICTPDRIPSCTPYTNINNMSGTVIFSVLNTTVVPKTVILANVKLKGVSTAAIGSTSALTLTIKTLSDSTGINRNPGISGITNGVITIGAPVPSLKGDLNGNGQSADAGDLVLMKRASIGEFIADSSYDLNGSGISADAGDLVLMKRASIGEIVLPTPPVLVNSGNGIL